MKTIAVVEDNPDNRLLVRVILEPLYEVTEYENGFAALAGLAQQPPDLVLLDISLPEMDGAEVLRRLRAEERFRKLPVIALTAHAMAGDREKYLAAGFDDYVTKPIVDETLLLKAIQKQLAAPTAPLAVAPPEVAALERLRQLGGDQFAGEMIRLFLDFTNTKLAEAKVALAAGDGPGVARAAHPIKSSAGNVGASRVQALAARLEHAAKATPAASLARLVAELEDAFAAVRPQLEAEQQRLQRRPA